MRRAGGGCPRSRPARIALSVTSPPGSSQLPLLPPFRQLPAFVCTLASLRAMHPAVQICAIHPPPLHVLCLGIALPLHPTPTRNPRLQARLLRPCSGAFKSSHLLGGPKCLQAAQQPRVLPATHALQLLGTLWTMLHNDQQQPGSWEPGAKADGRKTKRSRREGGEEEEDAQQQEQLAA